MTKFRHRRWLGAVAAVALLPLAGCGGGSGSSQKVPQPSANFGAVVDFAVPPAIANLPLTKSDGSTTTLAAYRGKPVMIADSLTLCTDICPMTSANVAALGRALVAAGYGEKVALIEITVDPQRDIPARLRAYQKLYGAPLPDWTLLTASPKTIKAIWGFFGVEYQRVKEETPPSIDWWTHKPLTYDVDHADDLIFLDASGRERFAVNAEPNVQGHIPPSRLVRTLTAQGKKLLRHPDPVTTWTVAQGLGVFSWLLQRNLS